MTAPITGPFTTGETFYGPYRWSSPGGAKPIALQWDRTWQRQAKPHDLPLPFLYRRRQMESTYVSTGPFGNFSGSWDYDALSESHPSVIHPEIILRSYRRLVADIGASVQGGVATAEGREACTMIVQRLGQMTVFTRAIFRGRFGEAAAALGVKWKDVKGRKVFTPQPLPHLLRQPKYLARESVRSLSKAYLEFHFGWAPLMKDIYDAMEVIQKPIRPHKVMGKATFVYPSPLNKITSVYDPVNKERTTETYTKNFRETLAQRADLIISNPNLAMMQQWGVVNPLSIAWELVPFSFVLDWFVTVGDYLNSLTDFAGVTLINPQKTWFTQYTSVRTKTIAPDNAKNRNTVDAKYVAFGLQCNRTLGISTPSIRLRTPKPWGYRRGLAAASLLMQAYPKRVVSESALALARKRTEFRSNVFPQFYGKYW